MRAILRATLLVLSSMLSAHPGIGIVQDRNGSVYYTDLKQVWRISPAGTRTVVVADVHTHELCLDGEGNLFGEHLWYEGERIDRWGHRVWRLGPDGSLATVIPPTAGFRKGYSFVRDAAGIHYWGDQEALTVIRKRAPDGRVLEHARAAFKDLRWMTASADGVLYLVDAEDLVKVGKDGSIQVLVKGLQRRRLRNFYRYDRHALMGLWLDRVGNVYVAGYLDREVKRVDPQGRVSVVARCGPGWGPTGGLVAADGSLWILEASVANSVRVRRIGLDGGTRSYP